MKKSLSMYNIEPTDAIRYSKLFNRIKWEFPWFFDQVKDQISDTEFQIQKWWANRIDLIDKKVNILSSGIGFYSVPFCYEKCAKHINAYDMDPTTDILSRDINRFYFPIFEHHQNNIIFDRELLDVSADIWINTSCEHSYYMKNIIPAGKLCVLSGNDCSKRGHINLINSVDQLINQTGLSSILFTDTMQFNFEDDMGKQEYNQYFAIGIKE